MASNRHECMRSLISLWVEFWIRDGLERRDNVLTRRERCGSVMNPTCMHESCSHQQPYPRALDNRGHLEKGYPKGPSVCDTGRQSNGVTVQDNAC